jgi:hypothetical protein
LVLGAAAKVGRENGNGEMVKGEMVKGKESALWLSFCVSAAAALPGRRRIVGLCSWRRCLGVGG